MESEEARAGLLQAIEIAVKNLESIFAGEELTIRLWQVRSLCERLDRLLLYGLRRPQCGYWPFVAEFCHEETTREITFLQNVNSNLGYGRAWLLGALQSGLLVCYFQSFVYNRKLVNKYYCDNALLRDTLRLKVTIHYLARLSNLKFVFVTNDSSLDQPKFLSTKQNHPSCEQNGDSFIFISDSDKIGENNNLTVSEELQKTISHSNIDRTRLYHWPNIISGDGDERKTPNNYSELDTLGHNFTPVCDSDPTALSRAASNLSETSLREHTRHQPGEELQMNSLNGSDSPNGFGSLSGPESLEQAVEMEGESDEGSESAGLSELDVSGAERYDIAQLLAKEALLKFVDENCKDEYEDVFYKVFLCYYYRTEQQHLSLIFLVLTTQRLLLLKTTDGYSLTQVASLTLFHIRQLRLAMDLQAIEIVWTSPREVFRDRTNSSPSHYVAVAPNSTAGPVCETAEVVEGVGMGSLQLVMLSAEQCSWVVGHIELALRRLGVREPALPRIRHGCRPVTLVMKDWTGVQHVLWASCERFTSRAALYERHASICGLHGTIVSRLFYRLVPKRLPKRGMESTILWRSARFELKAASLEQYDLESDVTPTAVYNLADPSCGGVQLCMENPRPFSFRVMWSSEPSLELAAESEFEFSEWLHSLLRSFQRYNPNKQHSSSRDKGASLRGKANPHQAGSEVGVAMGACLCSVVIESSRILIYRGQQLLDVIACGDVLLLSVYRNSFLLECRAASGVASNGGTSQAMNSAYNKSLKLKAKDDNAVGENATYTWIVSFYGETEPQVFLEHLRRVHPALSCRPVRDPTTQSILCEPREKTFNQLCSYAAKFCDIIA